LSELKGKQVLLIGLAGRGRAACAFLLRRGARVTGVDALDTPALREETGRLPREGLTVTLGATALPKGEFDFVVVSPAVPSSSPLVLEAVGRNLKVLGELELAFQHLRCLSIAITGTNGKGSVAELIEELLINENRRVLSAGQRTKPVCEVVDETANADFLVLQVNAFQLELTEYFRPVVAVVTNLTPDHLDRYRTLENYVRANAQVFARQQQFDWAIIQYEAFEQLRAIKAAPVSKVVTFSAQDQQADLYLDRGLIVSRLPNWSGPLLDLEHCRISGSHHAENFMAALAVGRALRIPLEHMVAMLKQKEQGRHRFELLEEWKGIQFINASKASNPHAVEMALSACRSGPGGQPNVWLLAGGRDKGADYHAVAPLIGRRVKGAFLFGEAAEKLRAAWGLFTPCTVTGSLLEAVPQAVRGATEGDVILLAPACSAFDQFRDYQHRGDAFCSVVKSICGGPDSANPKMHG
jgi:UDP-N-acetylmuramoylalanine--D-glutamate ligase